MSEFVTGERRGDTFVLTLRREPKLNAISGEMERDICDLLSAVELREAACVVFTGGARVFSAGADITEFADLDPAAIMSYYRQTGDFVERVADLQQPTIAAISGYCLGAVTEVVGVGEALDRALEHASRLAGLPRLAAGVAKRTIDAMAEAPRAAGLELERLAYGMLAQTSEADEGLKRFER